MKTVKLCDWFEINEQEYIWYRLQGYEIEFVEDSYEARIRWKYDGKVHRTDGPAVIWKSGNKAWFLHDMVHRTDGPAITYCDGDRRWFLNNIEYDTEEEFNEKIKRLV